MIFYIFENHFSHHTNESWPISMDRRKRIDEKFELISIGFLLVFNVVQIFTDVKSFQMMIFC